MQQMESHASTKRISRGRTTTRDGLIALLEQHATREYEAILRCIGERQCNSLGDFAMAEHMRSLMSSGAPMAAR